MQEVAVTFRVNFEAKGLTPANSYKMEKFLTEWLHNAIHEADVEALHEGLLKASGMNIAEFVAFVVADADQRFAHAATGQTA